MTEGFGEDQGTPQTACPGPSPNSNQLSAGR